MNWLTLISVILLLPNIHIPLILNDLLQKYNQTLLQNSNFCLHPYWLIIQYNYVATKSFCSKSCCGKYISKVQVNCLFCKNIKEWFTKKWLDIITLSIILQALLIAFDIIIPPSQQQIHWQQTGFGSVLPAVVVFPQRCMESSPILHKAKIQANKYNTVIMAYLPLDFIESQRHLQAIITTVLTLTCSLHSFIWSSGGSKTSSSYW